MTKFISPRTTQLAVTFGLTGLVGFFAGEGLSARAGHLENHPFVNWLAATSLLAGVFSATRQSPLSACFLLSVAAGNARGNYRQREQLKLEREIIRAESHFHAQRTG